MLRAGVIAAALLVSTAAFATPIYVQTTQSGADALFPGGTNVTFESATPGTYTSYSNSGVTFTGNKEGFYIDSAYSNSFNNFGQSLHNTDSGSFFDTLRMDFSSAVNGFGFFWGASDYQWTLSAYNASNSLIEAYELPITRASNSGDFVGLRDAGISYALLTLNDPNVPDYVFIDDLHTTAISAVPLPASAPMFGAALLALGAVGYGVKRKNAAKA